MDRKLARIAARLVIEGALADLVGSTSGARVATDRIYAALRDLGYAIVPREPTPAMLEAAWADALGEDAAAVWAAMIGAYGA